MTPTRPGTTAPEVTPATLGVLALAVIAAPVATPILRLGGSTLQAGTLVLAARLAASIADSDHRRRLLAPSVLRAPLLTLGVLSAVSAVRGTWYSDPGVPYVRRRLTTQAYALALVHLSIGAALLAGAHLTPTSRRWLHRILIMAGVVAPRIDRKEPGNWRSMMASHATALTYARLLLEPSAPLVAVLRCGGVALGVYRFVLQPLLFPKRRQWVSSSLAVVAALFSITATRFGRRAYWALPAGVLAASVTWPRIRGRIDAARERGDFDRWLLWGDALRIAARRPWYGAGPGNYPDYAMRYAEGYWRAEHPFRVMRAGFSSAHSNYLQVAAELGLGGLAVTGWLFASALRLGRGLATARELSQFDRSFAAGATGAIAGQLAASVFGDYLLPSYHNAGHRNLTVSIYSWILLGALMSMEARRARQAR